MIVLFVSHHSRFLFQLGIAPKIQDLHGIAQCTGISSCAPAHVADEEIHAMDQEETLSLLEDRQYRWECGCSQARMFAILAPIMRSDPEGLFGEDALLRMGCPRCGARHIVTREALEAYISSPSGGEPV